MTERRYSEEEVAAIFDLATKAQSGGRRIGSGDGMTLAGLHDIAREIGVPPELVTQAARSLDAGGQETSRSLLGLPVGVGISVNLGRTLSDAEWERLIVDLRETFDAQGRVRSDGNFRQWTNSRLQALVEPTAEGHRVRFKTYNGTLVGYMAAGVAMLGMAAFFTAAIATKGVPLDESPKMILPMFMAAAGVLSLAWGAIRVPAWARKRRRQFQELTARLMLPR